MAILAQPKIKSVAGTVVKAVKPAASTAPVTTAAGAVRAAVPSVTSPNKAAAMTNQQRLATDPSYVKSETQRALDVISQRQAQGMDISAQQKYLQKQLGYTGIIPAATKAPTNQLPGYVPIVSQQQQNNSQAQALFGNALQTLNSQNPQQQQLQELMQQFVTREQTPFSYDRDSDPNYQAGLAATKANITSGQNQTMAELNRRGILNSTITGDRAAQISADAYGRLETDLLPQYYQQAFQMFADQRNAENQQFTNQYNLAQMYDTQRQNEFQNQRTLGSDYQALAQQDFENRLSTADRTGTLQTAEVETLIQNIQALKALATAPGTTKEQRDAYSKQASVYRAELDAAGVDSTQFGANVTAADAARRSQAGTSTIQAQQLALQNKQFNVDTALRYGDQSGRLLTPQSDPSGYLRQVQSGAPLNYTAQQDKITNAQEDRRLGQTDRGLTETERSNRVGEAQEDRRLTFTEDSFAQEIAYKAQQDGIQNAIQWAGVEIQKEGMQLNWAELKERTEARLIENGFTREQIDQGWAGLDLDAQKAMMSGGTVDSAFTPTQIVDAIKEQFAREVPVYDEDGDQTGTKSQYPKNKDAATKDAIYQSVLGYGLPAGQEDQTLLALGLTQQDIAALDKKYAASLNAATGGSGGGKANTYQQTTFQQGAGAGAGSFNVTVGATSYVPAQLDSKLGGVLSGMGSQFVQAGKKYGINPAFLAAVAMHETGNGTSYSAKNRNNVGGMMKRTGGQQTFSSIPAGIDAMASNLKRLYVNEGKVTIPDIQRKYAPNGAANDPTNLNSNWTTGVTKYLNAFGKVSSA